mgnify:FL=1|jgi:peptide/nickel transport system substrate-binding protein
MRFIKKLILISISLFAISVSADTPKNTLVIAQRIDEIITLDPAAMFEFAAMEYANNTYNTLVSYDLDNVANIKGQVADSWEVSQDGKIYTFILNDNLKFASGNPVTADDVVFSLQRVILLDKAPSFLLSQFGFNKENVTTNIRSINNHTVELKLESKFAPTMLLYCLASPATSIVDKNLLLKHQENGDYGNKWLSTNYAGSGDFRLGTWQANEYLMLERTPNIYNENLVEKVIIRHVRESVTQKLLLKQGDIDIARNLTKTDGLPKEIAMVSAPKGSLTYMSLNQNHPKLKIPQVRQAIKYLIDYKGMAEALFENQVEVHQSFIPKGFFAADTSNPFSYNLQKAKSLLKEVGLEDGFDITMDVYNLELAQAIQASFATANIRVKIIPGDSKQIFTKFMTRKHDVLIATWGTDYQDPHANASTFTLNQNNSDTPKIKTLAWRSGWDIPKISVKTLNAATERDPSKREQAYIDLQQEYYSNSPLIVMYQKKDIAILSNKVSGLVLGPSFDTTSYANVSKG